MSNKISDAGMVLLTKLDQAQQDAERNGNPALAWLDFTNENPYIRGAFLRAKLIIAGEGDRENCYAITQKGQDALKLGHSPNTGTHTADSAPKSKLNSNTELAKHIREQIRSMPQAAIHQPNPCEGCVYRQALDILAQKVPAARELVEALRKIDAL
jgi:hypothetical protein